MIDLAEFSDKYHDIDIRYIKCIYDIEHEWQYYFLYAPSNKYSSLEEFLAACHKYILVNYEYERYDTCGASIEEMFKEDLLDSKASIKEIDNKDVSLGADNTIKDTDLEEIKEILTDIKCTLEYGYNSDEYIFYNDKKYCNFVYYNP